MSPILAPQESTTRRAILRPAGNTHDPRTRDPHRCSAVPRDQRTVGAAASPSAAIPDGWALEFDGLAGAEAYLAMVANRAERAGESPVLIAIMRDPTSPEIARLRAVGRLADVFAR